MPTFHVICVKVSQEGSMRCHFLPTFHGIVGKLSQVIHRMHHLPRYLRRIEPGGRSGVSSPCPPLKKVASELRAARCPVIPLSSSPLRRPRPRPERAASSFRMKKSQKKVAPERPRGERKRGAGAVPDGHRKFIDKTGRSSTSKVPKTNSRALISLNGIGVRGLSLEKQEIYKEEFDPGSG